MTSAAAPRLPRRQVFLFLIAILVPCLVLVALGLRLMAQDRLLEDTRRGDARTALVGRVRQDLLSLLEKIRLQEVTRAVASVRREEPERKPQATVAFVGTVVDGELGLPWEDDPRARAFRTSLNQPEDGRAHDRDVVLRRPSHRLHKKDATEGTLGYS